MPESSASFALTSGFVLLTVTLAVAFVLALHYAAVATGGTPAQARRIATRGAVGTLAWLALTAVPAASGLLHFTAPPTMVALLLAMLVLAIGLARSPIGRRLAMGLPLTLLVGFQAFRIPVELLLHRAYVEGLAPVQMTYAGRNFDMVSGLTAAALAVWLARGRPPRWAVVTWNVLGLALLANIVTIAILSAPVPFRVFMNEPANVWVTRAPWVWLPTVLVMAAVLGHALLFRRLAAPPPNDTAEPRQAA